MLAKLGANSPRCSVMFAAAAALTSGCGELIGADDYRITSADPASDASDSLLLPLLPAIPDESRVPGCEACVREQCGDLRETCLAEPRCRAMLACQGKCWDPACRVDCTDRLDRSYAFEDYFACAYGTALIDPIQSQCPEECGAGRNWECKGGYEWKLRSGQATVSVRARRIGLAASSGPLSVPNGAQVASCNDLFVPLDPPGNFNCGTLRDVSPYADGAINVGVAADDDAFVVLGIAGDRARIYPRPIPGSGPLFLPTWSVLPNNAIGSTLSVIEPIEHVDWALGFVVGILYDCLATPAEAQAWIDPPGLERRINPGGGAVILASEEVAGSAIFFNVQPGPAVRLRMKAPDGPEVEGMPMIVAPGWLTHAHLYPPQ